MRNRRFARGGFHVLRVHLCTHLVAVHVVPKRDCIRQVEKYARGRRGRRGHGGQADVLRLHADFFREQRVDGVLHDELGHHLPRFSRRGVRVVRAVDLSDVGPGHNFFRFAGVHKRAHAVDVAVQHVVLRVLVSAVHAFFCEHDRHVGTGDAGYVGVIVDGTAHFVLDEVERLPLRADLLSGDRHTADARRRPLDEAVDMGLAHGADDHDVVRSVPRAHAHSPDVVFETTGSDFRRNRLGRLRVHVVEVLRGREPRALRQRFGQVAIGKRAHFEVRIFFPPRPAAPAGFVAFQILEDILDVDLYVFI